MHAPPECSARVDVLLAALEPLAHDLITPALVIDLDAVDHNVAAMAAFAGAGKWRPHIKTVKQQRVVQSLFTHGVEQLKCATLDELALILDTAAGRAVDVLLAYPQPSGGARAAARLAQAHPNTHVRLLADHPLHLEQLREAVVQPPSNLDVMLDVDVGMARTGSAPQVWADACTCVALRDTLTVTGIHGYEGHLSWEAQAEAERGYEALVELAAKLPQHASRTIVTSGTHAFHHGLASEALRAHDGLHQVSPGTLVLSDLRSASAAKLLSLQQAAFVVSRVISAPRPGRVTLDAGSKGINPDCPPPGCAIVHHPTLRALGASEEHRPCEGPDLPARGSLVALVPEHVCTTVNLYREAHYVRAGKHEGRGPIEARSRTSMSSSFAL